MTKLIILAVIIALLYLYWKKQQQPTLKPKKGKEKEEVFWDAKDFELSSDEEDNNPNQ